MISAEDIKKLANLSRIEVSGDEVESLRGEIDSILGYVDTIKKNSEMGVQSVRLVSNVMREDRALDTRGKYRDKLLALSPLKEEGYFKVKKILE